MEETLVSAAELIWRFRTGNFDPSNCFELLSRAVRDLEIFVEYVWEQEGNA